MQINIFVFNPVQVNTYLLYDENKNSVLIDCGAYTPKEKKLLADFIEDHQLKIKYLLNTHLHFDHVLGSHFIYENYGIKPMYNEEEESMPGLKEQTEVFLSPIKYQPVMAEKFINEGDEITVGNIKLKALLTPGHSPGSLSFYCEENNCVFTGDALFQHDIGRTDLWRGNHEELVSNIKSKLLTLPDKTIVFPGHGPSSTIEEEKIYNPYL